MGGLAFDSSPGGLFDGTAALLPTKFGGESFRIKNYFAVEYHWLGGSYGELLLSSLSWD